MRLIGATLREVVPGRVTIELPFRPDLTQQHGFFHGGMTSAIADSAGGYAGLTLFGPNDSVLTVEFKINLLAPAQGEKLVATGQVVKAGKTLTVCELRVIVAKGERETLCALGQQTLICMKDRPDSGAPAG